MVVVCHIIHEIENIFFITVGHYQTEYVSLRSEYVTNGYVASALIASNGKATKYRKNGP